MTDLRWHVRDLRPSPNCGRGAVGAGLRRSAPLAQPVAHRSGCGGGGRVAGVEPVHFHENHSHESTARRATCPPIALHWSKRLASYSPPYGPFRLREHLILRNHHRWLGGLLEHYLHRGFGRRDGDDDGAESNLRSVVPVSNPHDRKSVPLICHRFRRLRRFRLQHLGRSVRHCDRGAGHHVPDFPGCRGSRDDGTDDGDAFLFLHRYRRHPHLRAR